MLPNVEGTLGSLCCRMPCSRAISPCSARRASVKVIMDFCVVPIGVGSSLAPYVAACQEVLLDAGLQHSMHAYGTNVEGEWEEVMEALRNCHERVHALGAPRVSTSMRLGTRVDRPQSMQDMLDSVSTVLEQRGRGLSER